MDFGLLSIIAATSWLDRLLGLEKFSIFDPQTSFSWQRPMPAWAWALVVMAVLIFAGWSYYKMLGKRPVRVALAVVRALLLLVIVALLAGPMLALESSRWTDDWLLILLDRSASMHGLLQQGQCFAINILKREHEDLSNRFAQRGSKDFSGAAANYLEQIFSASKAPSQDIESKIIRTIGLPEKRFSEDYLRMLRAIRFSNRFNFDIEEGTKAALSKNAEKISLIK